MSENEINPPGERAVDIEMIKSSLTMVYVIK